MRCQLIPGTEGSTQSRMSTRGGHFEAGSPRAVFGVPVYNHAPKLRKALDSLLSQSLGDFRIIISDDNSADETPTIAAEYVEKDARVTYHRNQRRIGYIENARLCFELARKRFPKAPYFAWGSDHDVWDSRWLETLIASLEAHPDAVLACPRTKRIDADGTELKIAVDDLSTLNDKSLVRRFVKTFDGMSAGNMVYGLFRADALERAGVMRRQLLPDRLLLIELSFLGPMLTVPEYLWHRRYRGRFSIERQIQASFPETPPAYIRLPWWIAHSGSLFHSLAISSQSGVRLGVWRGGAYAFLYSALAVRLVLRRWGWRQLNKVRTMRKRRRHARKLKRRYQSRTSGWRRLKRTFAASVLGRRPSGEGSFGRSRG
jgi:glycosyltransferase involved in cell wall biosynthesis